MASYLKLLHELREREPITIDLRRESEAQTAWQDLFAAVGVDITNVAEYTACHPPKDGIGGMTEVPSMVPPWPTSFFEFVVTPVVRDRMLPWDRRIVPSDLRMGYLVTSLWAKDDAANELRRLTQGEIDGFAGPPRELEPTGRLLCAARALLYLWINRRSIGPITATQWVCHADGRVVRDRADRPVTLHRELDPRWAAAIPSPQREALYSPMFYAIGFAHCRNVRQEEHEGRYESRQERRAAERRGEQPPVRFWTLRIDPNMGRASTEKRPPTGETRDLPLHIVRGHFAEYGDEYGKGKLFGKYDGRFFVPAHVRGSAEAGMVGKDYAIKAG